MRVLTSHNRHHEDSLDSSLELQGSRDARGSFERSESFDFDRLERAVSLLVEQQSSLRASNQQLRGEVDDKLGRIRELEERLLEANQHRQDAIKAIDDLVAQLDQLEASFERPSE